MSIMLFLFRQILNMFVKNFVMKKILIVKYLPGREFSNTAILYNHFVEMVKSTNDVEEIDLEKNPPPYFDHNVLMAYYRRNYQGKELSPEQRQFIKGMDEMVKKLKRAEIVVVVSPMHNFGMPGIVKLWFDAVIQKGETFDYGENGAPVGLLSDKKALVIFTSGGEYSCKQVSLQYPEWDTYSFLSKILFSFLGMKHVEVVTAGTANPNNKETNLHKAKSRIEEIIIQWKL